MKADLLQGTLDLLILKALSAGPLHGYGIIQRIAADSGELLSVEQGSLYPALYRIEQRGWLKSRWGTTETGRRARFYTLTRAGRRQLALEEESWDRLVPALARGGQATRSGGCATGPARSSGASACSPTSTRSSARTSSWRSRRACAGARIPTRHGAPRSPASAPRPRSATRPTT